MVKSIYCNICGKIVATDVEPRACPHCGHRQQLNDLWQQEWEQSPAGKQEKQSKIWKSRGLCENCGGTLDLMKEKRSGGRDGPYFHEYRKCRRCSTRYGYL